MLRHHAGVGIFTPSNTSAHLVCTPPFSSLSSLSNKGWTDGRTLMRHFTTPNRVVPCYDLQSLALQSCTTCLTPSPRDHALSASQQSFYNFFVIFSLSLFIKVLCQNTIPLIATPFLSVLFPVGCFALTHQVKIQNLR